MIPIRLLVPSLLTLAVVSCASQKSDQYDTVQPPSDMAGASQVTEPVNPVYDTPAAYEETSATTTTTTTTSPAVATQPNIYAPAAPAAPTAPSNGAAIIHTVVAGDTLSGISAKYKVPSAAIMQANRMTKDTVVLGRKMVIPPVQ